MTRGIEDKKIAEQIEAAVDDGNIVDLLEIDAASNRGIDDVRDLIEKIQFSPVVATAKVYIIDEVHMLTKEAFNALLKTLEEPPAYAYFILATTELNKIPVTVQSRCQCYPFRHIREQDIVRRLQFIADQEHINIEREAVHAIAHASEGGMRDAISLLDQMRSLETVTVQEVQQRIGATGHTYTEAVLSALAEKDTATLLSAIADVEDAGIPLDVFTRQLLKISRQQLHTAIEEGGDTKALLHMTEVLLEAISNIRISPVPGLVLEAALLSLCTEGAAPVVAPPATAAKEEPAPTPEPAKEVQPGDAPKVEKPVDNDEPEQEPEEQETLIEAPALNIDALHENWNSIVNSVTPASVKMSLKNGRVTDLDGSTLTVSFSSAFHRDRVKDTEASRSVEAVIEDVFKKQLKLHCTLENGEGKSASTPKSDDVVNLAEAAAEIF